MRVTILLADSAQAVQGKLYILGGAWSIAGPGPLTMALAINIEVPWTEANTQHTLHVALFDEDEHTVSIPTPTGDQPFEFHIPFEVGRPVGLKTGTPLTLPLALNLAPFLLRPDSRYVWRCFINGKTDEAWQASFSTRPQQPLPSA